MIALAVLAALVTQTNAGLMSVVQNLDDHTCAEARCIALYGKSCMAIAAAAVEAKVRAEKEAEAWRSSHTREIAACKIARARLPLGTLKGAGVGPPCEEPPMQWVVEARSGMDARWINQSDIRVAECVK